jgi:hypothetical protein
MSEYDLKPEPTQPLTTREINVKKQVDKSEKTPREQFDAALATLSELMENATNMGDIKPVIEQLTFAFQGQDDEVKQLRLDVSLMKDRLNRRSETA